MADNGALKKERDRRSDFEDKRKDFSDRNKQSMQAFDVEDIYDSFAFDGYKDVYKTDGSNQSYQGQKDSYFNQSNIAIKDNNGYSYASSKDAHNLSKGSDIHHQAEKASQSAAANNSQFTQFSGNNSSVYRGRYQFDYDKDYRGDAKYSGYLSESDREFADTGIDVVDEKGFVISHSGGYNIDQSKTRKNYAYSDKDYDNPLKSYARNPLEEYSNLGYGSIFRSYVGSDNKYHSEVSLFNTHDRLDRQHFFGSAGAFVDYSKKAFDAVQPESEEAAASNVDKKFFVGATIAHDIYRDHARRYKAIEKGLRNEEKQLGRNIVTSNEPMHQEQLSQVQSQNLYPSTQYPQSSYDQYYVDHTFANSSYQFSSFGGSFKDDGYDKFIQKGYSSQGEYYFAPSADYVVSDNYDMLRPSRSNASISKAEEHQIRVFMATKRLQEIKQREEARRHILDIYGKKPGQQEMLNQTGFDPFSISPLVSNPDKYDKSSFGTSGESWHFSVQNTGLNSGMSPAIMDSSVRSRFDVSDRNFRDDAFSFEKSDRKEIKGSVASKFENTDHRNLSDKEQKELVQAKKKDAEQKKKQAQKKAAVLASVRNLIDAKRQVQNSLGDFNGEKLSGDLVKDGKSGMLQSMIDAAKRFLQEAIKEGIKRLLAWLGSLIAPIAVPILIALAILILVLGLFCMYWGAGADHQEIQSGASYDLSLEEIDAIIDMLWITYGPQMTYERELLIRWGLSKIGCEYNQDFHWDPVNDIFDCSSYTYRAYREALGIDVSHIGQFSAAYIGLQIEDPIVVDEKNRSVHLGYNYVVPDGAELLPGDIICYGNSSNGRYKGIYHVAMYVGNGMMMEARGKEWGVVYSELRMNNVVVVGRYL